MREHQVAPGWHVLNAWSPSGPWLVRLECMGTKWSLVGTFEWMGTKWPMVGSSYMHGHQVAPGWYVLNAWAPSGPWMLRLECMGTKWPLVATS